MQCPFCKSKAVTPYMGGQFGKYQCKQCGYIGNLFIEKQAKVQKKKMKIPAYYRTEFERWWVHLYDAGFKLVSLGFDRRVREKFLLFIPKQAKRILDMGTGTGAVAIEVKKQFPRADVYGIDLSEEMLSIAKKKAAKKNLKITWKQENIEKTSFRNNFFDAITISFTLHELPKKNRKKVLQEAYRLLKKKGAFVIMAFAMPKNYFLQKFFLLHLKTFEEDYAKSVCYEDFVKELKRAGFRQARKTHYYNHLVQVVYGIK